MIHHGNPLDGSINVALHNWFLPENKKLLIVAASQDNSERPFWLFGVASLP